MTQGVPVRSVSAAGVHSEALDFLRAGGVVVLPTETLYGLSCVADNPMALARVASLKGLGSVREFVALVDGLERLESRLAERQDRRVLEWLRRVWPAPLSCVLWVRPPAPWGRAEMEAVAAAFRVPAHAWLRELLAALGAPVISTSVNRSGQPPLMSAAAIARDFAVDLVVEDPGLKAAAAPSTLLDATTWPPALLRRGSFDLSLAPSWGSPEPPG